MEAARIAAATTATIAAFASTAATEAVAKVLLRHIELLTHHFLKLCLLIRRQHVEHFLPCVRLQLFDFRL